MINLILISLSLPPYFHSAKLVIWLIQWKQPTLHSSRKNSDRYSLSLSSHPQIYFSFFLLSKDRLRCKQWHRKIWSKMQKIKVNSSKYENRFEKRSFNVSRSQQNLAKTINCLVCTLYKFTSRQQWIVCRSKYFLFLLPSKEDAFLIP